MGIGPGVIALITMAHYFGYQALLRKGLHESAALCILPVAVAVFACRYRRKRNPLHLILLVLSVVFFIREGHWGGNVNKMGVYIALGAIGLWAWAWRKKLVQPLQCSQVKVWLVCTASHYVLSQLIARRLFKHLVTGELSQLEHTMHVPLEEIIENTAHLMLLITATMG